MRRALAFALVVGCGSEDIPLTKRTTAGDASAPQSAVRCAARDDCPENAYCEQSWCDAGSGACALFPAQCTADESPVCGCDHVTYFNDCLRRAAGVSASTPGPCAFDQAMTCGGKSDKPCPEKARCARLMGFGGPCGPDSMGTCWVLPPACVEPTVKSNRWNECRWLGERCLDTCSAIRSGGAYYRSSSCP